MSKFEIISIDNPAWDDIVKSVKDYDIYYLSGYVKAFMIHGDGEPILIAYESDGVKAINVVMKRTIDIPMDKLLELGQQHQLYDFATPYGYGGFIIDCNCSEEYMQRFNEEYTEFCEKHHVVCEFVRFHPMLNNANCMRSVYDVVDLSSTIAIDTYSEDVIWKNIISKNRNVIRKAIKNGVQIFRSNDKRLIDEFMVIYNKTMDKDNATDYYYFKKDFYESIVDDLGNNAEFYYALYEDKIIAIAIILHCNGQLHYHLSASLREYSSLAATNLLLYKAACYGADNGYKTLHLGGGVGSAEDSLFKFKRAFNPNGLKQFSIGKKIFNLELYNKICEMSNAEEGEKFFPAYRAIKKV